MQKQDELIEVLKQELDILADNKSTEVIAFIGLKRLEAELNNSLTFLKKQLEESKTHIIDEMDNSPYEIIFNGRTYIRK